MESYIKKNMSTQMKTITTHQMNWMRISLFILFILFTITKASFCINRDKPTPATTFILPSYADQQLQQCLHKVFLNNHSLKQMYFTVKRLRSEAAASRAESYPKIDMIAQAGKSDGNTVESFYVNDDFSVSIPVSYELDVWNKLRSQSDSLLLESEAALFDRQSLSVTLVAEFMSRYYKALYIRNVLSFQESLEKYAKELTDLVTLEFEVGVVSQDKLYDQEQIEKELSLKRLVLEQKLARIEHSLNFLMGEQPHNGWLTGDFSIPSWLNATPQNLSLDLISQRPDLLSFQRQIEASGLKIKSIKSESFPSFFLTGYSRNAANEINNFTDEDAFGWGAFLGMRIPIFDKPRMQAMLKSQIYATDELQAEYESVFLKAMSEIQSAYLRGENENTALKIIEERNFLIANSFILTQTKYDVGIENLKNVFEQKQKFVQARMEHSKQQLEIISSRIQLFRALGNGWWDTSG